MTKGIEWLREPSKPRFSLLRRGAQRPKPSVVYPIFVPCRDEIVPEVSLVCWHVVTGMILRDKMLLATVLLGNEMIRVVFRQATPSSHTVIVKRRLVRVCSTLAGGRPIALVEVIPSARVSSGRRVWSAVASQSRWLPHDLYVITLATAAFFGSSHLLTLLSVFPLVQQVLSSLMALLWLWFVCSWLSSSIRHNIEQQRRGR